jgi:hypothetical protein
LSDQPRPARRFGQSRSRSSGVCPFGRARRGHPYNRRSRQHTASALTAKPGGHAKAARPTGTTRHCIHSDGEACAGSREGRSPNRTRPSLCEEPGHSQGTEETGIRSRRSLGWPTVRCTRSGDRARLSPLEPLSLPRSTSLEPRVSSANTRAIGSSTPGGAGCWMLVIAARRLSSCRMRLLTYDGESSPVVTQPAAAVTSFRHDTRR